MSAEKRLLSCSLLPDVLCPSRKDKFGIMDRCLKCSHYREFMEEMDEEEVKFWEEEEKIRKYGYRKRFPDDFA